MFHLNKGVVALRADHIEDVTLRNLRIHRLFNRSPLTMVGDDEHAVFPSQSFCSRYSSTFDGGNPHQTDWEGAAGSDTKGIAIYGGDVTFEGTQNAIEELSSDNGDAVGIHLMGSAKATVDDEAEINIDVDSMATGTAISKRELKQLVKEGLSPFPNNFFCCNILLDLDHREEIEVGGFDEIECRDIFGERIFDFRSGTADSHSASSDSY